MSSAENEEVQESKRYKRVKRRLSEAIASLDFEEADRISKSLVSQQKEELTSAALDIQEMHEAQIRNCQLEAQRQTIKIDLEVDNKISNCVKSYRAQFEELRDKQDEEVENLKNEWEKCHEEAELIARQKVESLLYTSKVMASCKYYDEAKETRNKAQETKDTFINKETRKVDKYFRKQFEQMLKRHQVTLDGLYSKMKNDLDVIRGEGNVARTVILSQEKINLSLSSMSTMLMKRVL